MGSASDGIMTLSHPYNAPGITSDKHLQCDMKFVKCLVRKNRDLTMTKLDDELFQGTLMSTKHPDVVRMWRQFHGCPGSGGGIEPVFFSPGKQYDTFKKKN